MIKQVATDVAIGLVAGLVGTIAITASQAIEMRLTGRKPSDAPARAFCKVTGIQPQTPRGKQILAQAVHWLYGTSWGLFRSGLDLAGVRGVTATAAHALAIEGAAITILPGLELAPPVTEWEPKEVAVEFLHHVVYATAAGVTYDALRRRVTPGAPSLAWPMLAAYAPALRVAVAGARAVVPRLQARFTQAREAARPKVRKAVRQVERTDWHRGLEALAT